MIVKQIWTGNAYRNFNYLIACPETGEALAIDPLDHAKCLQAAKDEGWTITQILNTHEHHDHTGGNAAVVAATGAKVLAHAKAQGRIAGMDRGLVAGDVITAINDEPVANIDDMLTALEKRQPGETVQLSVWRAGKQRKAAAVLAGGD